MNLYLISQDVNNGYDTYDSAVVAAKNEEMARNTKPDAAYDISVYNFGFDCNGSWAYSPDQVKVELIGKAKAGTKPGVICASFNAG